jgi:hypothetical protein
MSNPASYEVPRFTQGQIYFPSRSQPFRGWFVPWIG